CVGSRRAGSVTAIGRSPGAAAPSTRAPSRAPSSRRRSRAAASRCAPRIHTIPPGSSARPSGRSIVAGGEMRAPPPGTRPRRERRGGDGDLAVLEVGCSFGHMTEYLAEQREIATIHAFDADPQFVEIARANVDELRLGRVRDVRLFSNDETRRLPWPDGAFDLVLAIGVIEHLPRDRRAQVDEYYRVLAPRGHIAILDTPNRFFPLETHSIGLPLVQWMTPSVAYRYARL